MDIARIKVKCDDVRMKTGFECDVDFSPSFKIGVKHVYENSKWFPS